MIFEVLFCIIHYLSTIYQNNNKIKSQKLHLPKLDISSGKLTSNKFLKDPSRGNSPNFSKPKDENEANSSFNKTC